MGEIDLSQDATRSGPYGRAAHLYRDAGWLGVLPIGRRPGTKYPPPAAFTGHGKPDPSGADVEAWLMGDEAMFNIGLRLPAGVIGLDIDAYGSKRGAASLAELEAKFGPLPDTWITGARTDGVSGIRLYTVPLTLDDRPINWPGEAGKHIEIIQTGHRYAIVGPSVNPEAGGAVYRWRRTATGPLIADEADIPHPGELTALPEAWVRGLALSYDRTDKADLGHGALTAWLQAVRLSPEPCPIVTTVTSRALAGLADENGSRHETARDALAAVARLGGEGHRGVHGALGALEAGFVAAVGRERAIDNGEWQRLLVGAVKLAAAGNPTPRQHCEHDAATRIEAPEGFTVPVAAQVTAAGLPPLPAAPGALTLPDEFWQAREGLRRIRQAAHSRVRSGDVVFYGMLTRLAAMAPHTLRADTGIGSPASLNLFAAVVGPSGGGKSSGLSVSRDLVKSSRDLDEFPLGSGEGLAEAYMGEAEVPTGDMDKTGAAKLKRVRQQVRHNALFHSDEGNALNKLIERTGSTVGEALRTAWSGETLGQKNGRAETTRTVPARSYSMGLVIGYQPTTALPMLDDVEAGTPQRFLWCWAVDPSIPARDARVPWPGEMASPFPAHVQTDAPPPGSLISAPALPDLAPITFAGTILDELYEVEYAKNTGTLPHDHPLRDPFRSQHPVLQVKVAAVLALLESRRNVTEDDWRLAKIVLDTSDNVRLYLQALARDAAGKARAVAVAAEAELETHRAHARASVAAVLDSTAERRLAARVATWVHDGGPQTIPALKRRAASRDRSGVEAAVELAVEAAWLVYGDEAKVHPGPSRPSM
jgi:hypothetical protein